MTEQQVREENEMANRIAQKLLGIICSSSGIAVTEQMIRTENEMADRIARKILGSICPRFGTGGVPTKVAAKVMGSSEPWVRKNIETGLLPIGVVTPSESGMRSKVYISPKQFWEFTGFVYEGEQV